MSSSDSIFIACSCDEHYAPGLAAMVRSLLDRYTGRRTLSLFVLETNLSPNTKKRLLRSWRDDRLSVQFLRPDPSLFEGLPCLHGVHPAMYYYLALPELLPHVEKILKMDADMLILRDISELWETEVGSSPMAATTELLAPYVSSPRALANYETLKIPPMTKYCNAGLQLMNLRQWRTEGIAKKILHYTRTHRTILRYWDQDGVNAILAGRWLTVDDRWNVEAEALMLTGWTPDDPTIVEEIIRDAWILHFVVYKPWKKHCPHPRTALFLHTLLHTAWWPLALLRLLHLHAKRTMAMLKKMAEVSLFFSTQ